MFEKVYYRLRRKAAFTTVRLYASLNGSIDSSSTLIASRPLPRPLQPGDSFQLRIPLVIPAGTPAGQYHLIAATGSLRRPNILASIGSPFTLP